MCKKLPDSQYPVKSWTVYYNGRPVRIFYINNIFWCVLMDVCILIGLGNPSRAADRLDDDEKMTLPLSNSHSGRRGGAQKLLLINEPGLYHLLLTSNKPEAKYFQRWITFDVLPSLRRNGGYIMGQDSMDAAELKDASQEVAQNILAERDRRIQDLRLEKEAKAALLREWEPKVRFCDAVLQSLDAVPITVIAKDYGWSAQAMNRYLYDRGVQYPCGGTWVLYQCYAGKGYVHPETILYSTAHCRQYLRWTQKGRAFLYDLLRADSILPLSERTNVPADSEDFWLS